MSVKKINTKHYKIRRNKIESYDEIFLREREQMYQRLLMVAMSVFEWKNLPLSVDELFLERNLTLQGRMLFFSDETLDLGDGGYLVTKFRDVSHKRDVYGIPTKRDAYAIETGINYNKQLTFKNSVIIYDNILRDSFVDIIDVFADRLTKIKMVIDRNIAQQKRPYIIGAKQNIAQELETFFIQVERGKEFFIVEDEMLSDLRETLQVYPTNAELIADKLNDYYDAVWNEFMTFVGVGTNVSPKRERLVAGEVDSFNEQAQVYADARYKARKRACKEINNMFGLNVDVKYAFDKKGGEEVVSVHGNPSGSPEKSSPEGSE